MSGAVVDTRLPREGVARRWMLLGERTRIIAVAAASLLAFVLISMVLSPAETKSMSAAPAVRHSVTDAEVEALRAEIRAELEAQHAAELGGLEAQAAELEAALANERGAESVDEAKVKALEAQLAENQKALSGLNVKHAASLEDGLQELLGQQLADMQENLLESGAREILSWFCAEPSGETGWPTGDELNAFPDVTTSTVELPVQPCFGVAGRNEPVVQPSAYQATDRTMARHVAYQALHSLRAADPTLERSVVAPWAFNATDSSRCCDTVLFAVHPVFGVFYKTRLPLVDRTLAQMEGAEEDAPVDVRTMCFRRRWVPKPVITPLTYKSTVDHLVHPGKLPGGPDAPKARALASDPGEVAPPFGTRSIVHFILPFRARNLGSLPSLLRTMGVANLRSRYVSEEGAGPPGDHSHDFARLIIVPIAEDGAFLGEDFPVLDRVREAIEAATPQVHFNITLVTNLPESRGNKGQLTTLLRKRLKPYRAKLQEDYKKWVAAAEVAAKAAVVDPAVKEDKAAEGEAKAAVVNPEAGDGAGGVPPAETTAATMAEAAAHPLLPNAWLRAVVTGLEHVPSMSAPVFILDSSTSAVAPSLARKTLWRVVEGRQVYVPVPSALHPDMFASDDAVGLMMRDGGITQATFPDGEAPAFRTPHFYKWVDPAQGGGSVSDAPQQRLRSRQLESEGPVGLPGLDDTSGQFFTGGASGGSSSTTPDMESSDTAWQANFGSSMDDASGANSLGSLSLHHGEDDAVEALPSSEPLWDRHTSLGAAKADIVGAILRVLKHAPAAAPKKARELAAEEAGPPPQLGDECIMRRILLELKNNKYTLARAVRAGFRVTPVDLEDITRSGTTSTVAVIPAEEGVCECDTSPFLPHCELSLPLSSMDATVDKERVNCAVTQMLGALEEEAKEEAEAALGPGAAPAEGGEAVAQEGPAVEEIVRVHHPVRYFQPHRGTQLVAKVANVEAQLAAGEKGKLTQGEIFSFDWFVSDAAVSFYLEEDMDST